LSSLFRWSVAACAAGLVPIPAHAQRTDENAVTSAEDAFGKTVGRETIGIYDESDVRGFSPSNAGNFRIEGLYFDNQGGLTGRVNDSETIHVGPSAQGFAFPAPTGIVDLSLRASSDKRVFSSLISANAFGGLGLEIDTQFPLGGSNLTAAAGGGVYRDRYANGGSSKRWNAGMVPRWHPSPNVEIVGFLDREQAYDDTPQGTYIPTGDFLPGKITRGIYPGPSFTRSDYYKEAFGLLGRAVFGDWTLRIGAFRSIFSSGPDFTNIINVLGNGSTTRSVFAYPSGYTASWSGELRLSRKIADGKRSHLISISLRDRQISSRYGDGSQFDIGTAPLNGVIRAPKPVPNFGSLTDDRTYQPSIGLSYTLHWQGLGDLTLGAQRSNYTKRVAIPDIAPSQKMSRVWLPSLSVTAPITRHISLYASYVRGLEDSGIAPGYAINGNQLLPALKTKQYDVGLRWSVTGNTIFLIGYYDIAKPYIDLDTQGLYGVLGIETHRGVEASLTTKPSKNLTLVAGGFFSHPRVSTPSETMEAIGPTPVGRPDIHAQVNVDYRLPFAANISLDGDIDYTSKIAANIANTIYIPGRAELSIGARYRFKISKAPATFRLSVTNITNSYRLIPISSGVYAYNNQRAATLYLAADF
jgi:iron complex outermembrane recepter protein